MVDPDEHYILKIIISNFVKIRKKIMKLNSLYFEHDLLGFEKYFVVVVEIK